MAKMFGNEYVPKKRKKTRQGGGRHTAATQRYAFVLYCTVLMVMMIRVLGMQHESNNGQRPLAAC